MKTTLNNFQLSILDLSHYTACRNGVTVSIHLNLASTASRHTAIINSRKTPVTVKTTVSFYFIYINYSNKIISASATSSLFYDTSHILVHQMNLDMIKGR